MQLILLKIIYNRILNLFKMSVYLAETSSEQNIELDISDLEIIGKN